MRNNTKVEGIPKEEHLWKVKKKYKVTPVKPKR